MKLALLHVAPKQANLEFNRNQILYGLKVACDQGAEWILTPEAGLTGYFFSNSLGTDWIQTLEDDPFVIKVRALSKERGVAIFLCTPERDATTNLLYNSIAVLEKGELKGVHRKVNVLPGPGPEGWSSPGPVDPSAI